VRGEIMRYKKRRILLLVLIFVLLLNVLRLVGIIDFNLYSSSINSNQTASIANSKKLGSYRIEFEYNNKKIYTHIIMNGNQELVPVIVKIEEYNFTGNYFMPFYKKFTTTYKCIFKTSDMSTDNVFTGENQISGEVEGTVVLKIRGIPMLPREMLSKYDTEEYRIRLLDFGCLTKDNLEFFLAADIKILILGAKEWELEYAEQVLEMVTEYKDIFYLFNYLDGRYFRSVLKNMKQQNCYRIPYEPDPFLEVLDKNELELFDEITR
jgi:hypothetical protein